MMGLEFRIIIESWNGMQRFVVPDSAAYTLTRICESTKLAPGEVVGAALAVFAASTLSNHR